MGVCTNTVVTLLSDCQNLLHQGRDASQIFEVATLSGDVPDHAVLNA